MWPEWESLGLDSLRSHPWRSPTLLKGLALQGRDGNPGKQVQVQQEGLELERKKDLHTSSPALPKGIEGRCASSRLTHALLIMEGCQGCQVLPFLCREEEAQGRFSSPLPLLPGWRTGANLNPAGCLLAPRGGRAGG